MSDEEGGGGGHGGGGVWIYSYADMVTLLLAFFIVMYTMSQIDIHKLKALVGSLNATFDPQPTGKMNSTQAARRSSGEPSFVSGGSATMRVAPPNGVRQAAASTKGPGDHSPATRAEKNLQQVADKVQEVAKKAGLQAQVKTSVDSRGVHISFAENADSMANVVPFASGSAELNEGFKGFLDRVAPLLRDVSNKIEVQGHTDRRPIHTSAYPSNWELSAARAGSVVRYFVERHGLGPRQFVCTGYADTNPVEPADTQSAWAHNRRIEILITRVPIDVYDNMTRADAQNTPVDITQPLGPSLIPLNVKPLKPHKPGTDEPKEEQTTVETTASH